MLRNQVTLVGKLNKEAMITTFENGAKVARFYLTIKNQEKSGEVQSSCPMFAWGNTANFLSNFCQKGSDLAVSGRLVNRTYVNQKGEPKRVTEIEVRQVVKF
ncbi:MAG TPA: single-stranded DNA-binding protein [Fluviicola sp.]|nr:single-stranded DNA-binding protein [Fluviicola sp.]